MAARPEVVELQDVGHAVGRPAARRAAAPRIADHRVEIALLELGLHLLAHDLLGPQREGYEVEEQLALHDDAAVGEVCVEDRRAAQRPGTRRLTKLPEQVAVAGIAVGRIAHRGHEHHLTHVEGLAARLHVLHAHIIEPHLCLFALHVGNARAIAPLPHHDVRLVADRVETEITLLGRLAEGLEDPCGNGDVVDLRGDDLEQGRLEEQIGIGGVHAVDLRPRLGEPPLVEEVLLVAPLVERAADELGARVEQHALVVGGAVYAVGRRAGRVEKLGLRDGAREIIMQHLLGDGAPGEGVIARVGHGIGTDGDLGPLAAVPLLFAARGHERQRRGAKYRSESFHGFAVLAHPGRCAAPGERLFRIRGSRSNSSYRSIRS